jgi:hypothetical protein
MDDSIKQDPSGEWPTLEAIAQWAREAAEELPGMEEMMRRHIDTATFLDEDALPPEDAVE